MLKDEASLATFRALPEFSNYSDYKGKMMVDSFIKSRKAHHKLKIPLSETAFDRAYLNTPGAKRSLYNYLTGDGYDRIPEIAGAYFGDKWYGGLAKLFAHTSMGKNMVLNKILEKTLPKVNGSTALARECLTAGGNV